MTMKILMLLMLKVVKEQNDMIPAISKTNSSEQLMENAII